MYTCGITPYDAAHLGHVATYLDLRRPPAPAPRPRARDALRAQRHRRRRRHPAQGPQLGVHYLDLAAEETARFDEHMRALGLLPSYAEPRATSAISDILRLIGNVLDAGHAYRSGGAVYFDISSFAPLRRRSAVSTATRCSCLAAERGGNPEDPNKDDPLDFVLWQPSLADEPSWESRWGPGRPGLAHRVLGARHCESSANDRPARRGTRPRLPPPRMRGRAVRGRDREPFVRHWMHVGMVRPRRREDVEVTRQPRLRRRSPEGPRARRRSVWRALPALPQLLGLGGPPLDEAADAPRRWRAAGCGRAAALEEVRGPPRRRSRHARARSRDRRGRALGWASPAMALLGVTPSDTDAIRQMTSPASARPTTVGFADRACGRPRSRQAKDPSCPSRSRDITVELPDGSSRTLAGVDRRGPRGRDRLAPRPRRGGGRGRRRAGRPRSRRSPTATRPRSSPRTATRAATCSATRPPTCSRRR